MGSLRRSSFTRVTVVELVDPAFSPLHLCSRFSGGRWWARPLHETLERYHPSEHSKVVSALFLSIFLPWQTGTCLHFLGGLLAVFRLWTNGLIQYDSFIYNVLMLPVTKLGHHNFHSLHHPVILIDDDNRQRKERPCCPWKTSETAMK